MLATEAPPRKVFDTIQILRGIAALIVVGFHLTHGYHLRGEPLVFGGMFIRGYAGVDLFFVISGFVIMHTSHRYLNTPSHFSVYLRKRLVRIYPIYWLVLTSLLLSTTLVTVLLGVRFNWMPTHWTQTLRSYLLLPNHPDIVGVTWSLSYELLYYLVFGLLMLSRYLWPLVGLVLVGSVAALVQPTLFPQPPALPTFVFSPFNLEFASGVVAWWLLHRYRAGLRFFLWLIPVVTGWILYSGTAGFYAVGQRTLVYGATSFLLVFMATGLEANGAYRPYAVNRLLLAVGDASYLIYIIHFPFLHFYGKYLTPRLPGLLWQNLAALGFMIVITAIGVVLHRRVEVPLVRTLNLLFEPNNRPSRS